MQKKRRAATHAIVTHAFIYTALVSGAAHAVGVVPDTSVVLIDEHSGEAVVRIRNTDPHPVILHTRAENIPEDTETLFVVNPPIARVEPGQTQLVRFMLINESPLQRERMKRVVFEGLPPSSSATNELRLIVRHDLPVLLHPRDLPVEHEPWKRLEWSVSGDALSVSNPSPYVVRLDQRVETLPAKVAMMLPRRYILPGERFDLHATDRALVDARAVRLFPASSYGYEASAYEAALQADAAGRSPVSH